MGGGMMSGVGIFGGDGVSSGWVHGTGSGGIIAPIGVGYFVYSEMKARRADREAAAAAQARAEDASATQNAAPLTAEQKLADRYGRRR